MTDRDPPSPRRVALMHAIDALPTRGIGNRTALVPISASQWERCLSDGELRPRIGEWRRARIRLCAHAEEDAELGRVLRPAAIAFAEEVGRVSDLLELLATFDPGDDRLPRSVDEWRRLLVDDAFDLLQAAIDQRQPPAPPQDHGRFEVGQERERDVLLDVFGVSGSQLSDENGSFCDTRVIASFRLRLDQLQRACDPILGLVAECPPSVFTAVSAVRDLVTSASPLLTLCTARDIRSRILSAFDSDPRRTREVLADAAGEGDKEWESFGRLQHALRRAEAAKESTTGTDAEFAVAILEAYRHMAEGITRRWVGTLLLLSGLEGPPPGLGAIAEPAVSRLGELGLRIEAALIPALRNVEAHDDFVFDEDTGLLVSGSAAFIPGEILACLTDLDVLQRGLIVGRLAAFADRPGMSNEPPGSLDGLSSSSALSFARQRFGHAGQHVRSFVRNRDRIDVAIDDLRSEACNPCFVALTQVAQVPSLSAVKRFTVRIRDQDDPVIDLPANVLRENWPVFELAARRFPDGLPQATFLPCLTWCRLACEPVDEAARVAAWMALNDACHAILDANAAIFEYRRLPARFGVVAAAAAATVTLLPEGSHMDALARAHRIVRAAEAVLLRDPDGIAIRVLTDRIFGLRDGFGGPFAALPTLDLTPVAESSYPHATS